MDKLYKHKNSKLTEHTWYMRIGAVAAVFTILAALGFRTDFFSSKVFQRINLSENLIAENEIVFVDGFDENGIRFDFSESGVYRISYSDGAYSAWPNDESADSGSWYTGFTIYQNREIEWGVTNEGFSGSVDWDHFVGTGNYFSSKDEAISLSQGHQIQIQVEDGDYVTIGLVDEHGYYGDNRGGLEISVEMVRQ